MLPPLDCESAKLLGGFSMTSKLSKCVSLYPGNCRLCMNVVRQLLNEIQSLLWSSSL